MSETREQKKKHIEDLYEDAWEWWSSLAPFEQEDKVLKIYMKKFNITDDMVEF